MAKHPAVKADLVFVDTNVLLYAVDDREPGKRDRARQWLAACWRRRCGRLSTQVLNEFYWNASRKFSSMVSRGDARAEVRRYQQWLPWQVDHATVETAWAAEARYGLAYWDALLVAAAKHQGCDCLLSEDLQHEQSLDGILVLNPFLADPDLLDKPA
jgi:predicted nucleic acid-binding protein